MAKEYVEQRDGNYCVAGSRISLDSIVYAFCRGESPTRIETKQSSTEFFAASSVRKLTRSADRSLAVAAQPGLWTMRRTKPDETAKWGGQSWPPHTVSDWRECFFANIRFRAATTRERSPGQTWLALKLLPEALLY